MRNTNLEPPERRLPANYEAEKRLLGAIIIDNELFSEVSAEIQTGHFYHPTNRMIYRAMVNLAKAATPIDPITLMSEVDRQGQTDIATPAYIADLFDGLSRFGNVASYVKLVRQVSMRRDLIATGSQITDIGYDRDLTESEALIQAQNLITQIEDPSTKIQWHNAGDLAFEHLQQAEEFAASGRQIYGMPTGFHLVDRMMDGLQKKDLIILGARPSMGKSGLVSCLALGVAAQPINDNPVIAYFPIEMGKEQQVNRFLSILSTVEGRRISHGKLSKDEWKKVIDANEILASREIFIDDQSNLTPNQMRLKCQELVRYRKKLDLIICDYLQIMRPDRPTGNSVQDVSQISKELKAIAKEFNVPVIAVVSLSRNLESRADKRPQMSDIRESGQIESDADVVMFLYREEYYRPETEKKGIALIDWQKQRNGPTGAGEMNYIGHLTKFDNKY